VFPKNLVEQWVEATMQNFLSLLHDQEVFRLAESLQGYDVQQSGRMLFPKNNVYNLFKDQRSE
jgi:hypothetical protein